MWWWQQCVVPRRSNFNIKHACVYVCNKRYNKQIMLTFFCDYSHSLDARLKDFMLG